MKGAGSWTLTAKGEKALELPAGELIRSAQHEYRKWHKSQKGSGTPVAEVEIDDGPKAERQATYDSAQETARTEIEQHIDELTPYEGLLRRDGDIGLFVSSGGFSREAEREIRSSHKHIETMDLSRLISLWQ
jgi:hypothetical protein